MKTIEFDTIFLSYDEPNAEKNYADLCSKVPWAQRIHGVKGSDAAHKAAAELADTDWFITIDADNIVNPNFFDLDISFDDPKVQVYSWCGENTVNGLIYGNGGVKLWHKDFVRQMQTHEAAEHDRAQVDFCWENGYKQFKEVFSTVHINTTPLQAWRAGFREGVKMTLLDGEKVHPQEIEQKIWWHNIHRLKIWSTIGTHAVNGKYAVLGARQGAYMTNCTDWDYIQVRDFDYLTELYNEIVAPLENIDAEIQILGKKLNLELGFSWPYLDNELSLYFANLYKETINLGSSYFRGSNV